MLIELKSPKTMKQRVGVVTINHSYHMSTTCIDYMRRGYCDDEYFLVTRDGEKYAISLEDYVNIVSKYIVKHDKISYHGKRY